MLLHASGAHLLFGFAFDFSQPQCPLSHLSTQVGHVALSPTPLNPWQCSPPPHTPGCGASFRANTLAPQPPSLLSSTTPPSSPPVYSMSLEGSASSAALADADPHSHSRALQASPIQGLGASASAAALGRRESGMRRAPGGPAPIVLPQVGSDLVSLDNEKRRLQAELASLQGAKAELDARHAQALKAHDAQKASLGSYVDAVGALCW